MQIENLSRLIDELAPLLREHGVSSEAQRCVDHAVVEELRRLCLFDIWRPKTLDGWELAPAPACRAIEQLAELDSAAAWMVQMCSAVSLLSAWFSDSGIEEMYRIEKPVFGDSFTPPMKLEREAGGFSVSGQASFASNCQHIDWFIGLGVEHDENGPLVDTDGHPVTKMFAVNRDQFDVVENWDTVGMRGTGSHDVRLDRVSIPQHLSSELAPIEEGRNEAYRIPIVGMAMWIFPVSMAALALGVASAAYKRFLTLCDSKTPNYFENKVGEGVMTQYNLGAAHARLGAARAFLYYTIDEVWDHVFNGGKLTVVHRSNLAACSTFAIDAANQVIDLLAKNAGTSMVRETDPLTRHFRDLHTLGQHTFVTANRYRDVGALCLNRPAELALYNF